MVVGGFLGGCRWLWVIVCGCGSLWMVVGDCGWLRVVAYFSISLLSSFTILHLLVTLP